MWWMVMLLTMILAQAALCALIGTGLGLGLCAVAGRLFTMYDFPYRMMWFAPVVGGTAVLLVGVLDSGANTLYALATDHGLLSLVSVLSSLYPLTTVLLAQALLREHVSRHQKVGVIAALAGIALISAG